MLCLRVVDPSCFSLRRPADRSSIFCGVNAALITLNISNFGTTTASQMPMHQLWMDREASFEGRQMLSALQTFDLLLASSKLLSEKTKQLR
ncbi:hypothetical protein OPV22_008464 [Ensete ventricosum]|uniref:Uncharacterized protein n=1 Tax=Ensete ventricosum TaxID=4639 RepID=A0AAV8RH19_ENSVE|nr:hypothetical protein OPV22_008464 [Ensete ventricosum]